MPRKLEITRGMTAPVTISFPIEGGGEVAVQVTRTFGDFITIRAAEESPRVEYFWGPPEQRVPFHFPLSTGVDHSLLNHFNYRFKLDLPYEGCTALQLRAELIKKGLKFRRR